MEAEVIFKIGEIEIKTTGKAPTLSSIPKAGKINMAALSAMSKVKKELGIDLYKFDENINQKAIVTFKEGQTS